MQRETDYLRVSLMNADSNSDVAPSSADFTAPRKLSAGQRQSSLGSSASVDSLVRQLSGGSQLRRERSSSKVGATIANVPLSTQQPSKLISKAGERVRAYSDSLDPPLHLSRQHSDSHSNLQAVQGEATLASHDEAHEAHEEEHHHQQQYNHQHNAALTSGRAVDSSASGASFAGNYMAQSPASHRRDSLPYLNPDGPVNMIAFVNFNSGGKNGRKSAQVLMDEIGKNNVYNLDGANPTRDLETHLRTPNLRIAVCGGDGTVNWVLSCIAALPFNPLPAVGILPFGTGNDTARAFGWGFKFPGKKGIAKNVRRMMNAPIVTFDRWHCTIEHKQLLNELQVKQLPAAMREMKEEPQFLGYQPPSTTMSKEPEYRAVVGADDSKVQDDPQHQQQQQQHQQPTNGHSSSSSQAFTAAGTPQSAEQTQSQPTIIRRECQFNNYLSFGIDAQIQYEFHEHREHHRHLYVSRLCNMGWMTVWGAANLLCCRAFDLVIKVEVPDRETGEWQEMTLPPNVRSIVLLNGTTYAGGRHIWGHSESKADEYHGPPPSYNDGLLELMGTENTLHLSLMLIKVRRAIRIAQVHEVRITTSSPIHAQLDGEPWMEQSSVYHIRRIHQALMIDGKTHKPGALPGSDE